jgi:Antitoxin VbhA
MNDRAQIAAAVAGSLRLEGLEPTAAGRDLTDRWVKGEVSNVGLREASRRLLSRQPLDIDSLPVSGDDSGSSRAA